MVNKAAGREKTILHIIGDFLSFIQKKLGVFGPFSFKLIFGLALGLGALFLFAKLTEDLLFNELLLFDRIVTSVVRFFSSDRMTMGMKAVSQLGSPWMLVIVGMLMMLYTGIGRRHFWDTVLVPIALIGGMILNETLKYGFHRQRPGLHRLVEVSGFSFPSGHSMMSFIFYGLMVYLVWANFPGKALKLAVSALLICVIPAVGISRIYLGVHYPSDVLAGFSAGGFWLVACILGLRGIRYHKADQ
ncbi:MAG: phosphatase PAP2 family protein [Patescibacteria group bacterium]